MSATLEASQWFNLLAKISKGLKMKPNILKTAFMTGGFSDVIKHFNSQSGPTNKWPPRSPATQEYYARMNKFHSWFNPKNKLGVLTGKMRQSFLQTNVEVKSADSIVFFNHAPYSGYFDEGTNKMPKRQFMWLSTEAKERMAKIMLSLIAGPR